MKRLFALACILLSFCALKAQTLSSCVAPPVLRNNYDRDVKHLALQRIYQQNSPAQDSVVIPFIYQDTIWQTLAAIFNASSIPQRDSVFNYYCIHQDVSDYIFNEIDFGVDTSYAWVHNWMNLQTTTGIPGLDSLLSTFGFSITQFVNIGDTFPSGAYFTTAQNINVKPLCAAIESLNISGLAFVEPTPIDGAGNQLTYFISGTNRYVDFTIGLGDCPSGCTGFYTFQYQVDSDCSVYYSGTGVGGVDGHDYKRPINCNLTSGPCATTDSIADTVCSGDTVYVGTHAHFVAGTYVDTLINGGGCDSIVTLWLIVKPAPPVPNITLQQGHVLQSDTGAHYQWYLNDTLLPGDTSVAVFAAQNGNYQVKITGANGCSSISSVYDFTQANLPVPTIVSDTAYDTANYLPASLFACEPYGRLYYQGQNLIFLSRSLNADSVVWNVTQFVCYWTYTYSWGYQCDSFANCLDTIMRGDSIALLPWFNDNYWNTGCGQGSVNNLIVCLTAYNQYGSASECDTTCDILYDVAITEVPSPKISLYPNPTTDLIYIQTQGLHPNTTNIYDVNGQLVSTMRFAPQVDVSHLAAGVYLVEVTAAEGTARRRFVKM